MKELICANQIENILEKGEKVVYITSKTILTPSAKDIIANNNMEIVLKEKQTIDTKNNIKDIDIEKIVEFFKLLAKEEAYQNLIMDLLSKKNFDQEKDLSGFTLIKGKNMIFNHIKDKNINILYQEVLKEDTKNITILEIENSNFSKKITCEEIIYIAEGKVIFKIGKKEYRGEKGDIIYMPSTVKNINFQIEERVKFFSVSEKTSWVKENLILEGNN